MQTVPTAYKTEEVYEIQGFLRAMLGQVDSSLIREWENMLQERPAAVAIEPIVELKKTLHARIRAEMHALVKALALGDFEAAVELVTGDATEETFARPLRRFTHERGELVFDHRARYARLTLIKPIYEDHWSVHQTLVSTKEETDWCIEAQVDVSQTDGPLLNVLRVGSD